MRGVTLALDCDCGSGAFDFDEVVTGQIDVSGAEVPLSGSMAASV